MMKGFTNLWDSRKFTTAAVAALVAALGVYFGWSEQAILVVISPLLAAIGVEGAADIRKARPPQDPN